MSPDLSTRYLGMDLANPVIASPSPLTGDLDELRKLDAAGAGAVVLPSVFEEEIEHDAAVLHELDVAGADSFAEALGGYLPSFESVETTATRHLRLVEAAKAAVAMPVIASATTAAPIDVVREIPMTIPSLSSATRWPGRPVG